MACNFLAVIFFNYVFLGHLHGLLLTDPAHVEQRLNQMESQIQGLSQEVNALKQENAALKAQVSSGNSTLVYFSAYLKNSVSPSSIIDVVYDGVRSNYHNSYNPATGRFTAPVKGLYVFAWETVTGPNKIFDTVLLWNLVCSSESLGSMTTTVAVIGQLVGSGVFPSLADKYGRLVVTYTNAIALVICYILAAIVPWFSAFVILRFLLGAFGQGVGLSLATLALELFPAESRGFVVFLGSIFWSLSISSISLVGFLLRHVSWRYTMLTAGLIGAHTLASRWILQESPRWLMANGRYDDVREWIKQAAKWNKKDISNILVDLDLVTARSELQVIVNTEHSDDENEAREKNSKEAEEGARLVGDRTDSKDVQPGSFDKTLVQEESLSVLDIFRHRHILLTSLIVWIVWFVNGLTYYGLFLTSGTMTGNMYLNFFLNGVVEIPSIFFYMFTINRYGRKITCIIFHAIAGVCLCASAVLLYLGDSPVMEALALALSFAGKFGISGSFATIFLYTPEIYPTNLRAIGMGLASLASRIAAMISPYAGLLGTYIQWGPGVVFGTLSVLVTILFLWLPETTGKELPNTLDDVKHFYVIKQKKNKS